ncbi:MAG: MBL fold metallo-hydrolase [Campylobacterales bacterium]|nr:MBL fold metallo-hydrolase [Campylobacterales bacterium]
MNIKIQPMGAYQTNCYIVAINGKDLIIDPGVGAASWVKKNLSNPIAILNTHGHFDHVWSNDEVAKEFNIPIYCPKDDCFMLQNDPFGQGTPKSNPSVKVAPDTTHKFEEIEVKFLHFPGHTPGCSVIQIGDAWFSGDFLFDGSIGRVDFPYSNPDQMKQSIHKALKIEKNFEVFPGHGGSTTLQKQKSSLKAWLNYI